MAGDCWSGILRCADILEHHMDFVNAHVYGKTRALTVVVTRMPIS
jgi:hypothetical protein